MQHFAEAALCRRKLSVEAAPRRPKTCCCCTRDILLLLYMSYPALLPTRSICGTKLCVVPWTFEKEHEQESRLVFILCAGSSSSSSSKRFCFFFLASEGCASLLVTGWFAHRCCMERHECGASECEEEILCMLHVFLACLPACLPACCCWGAAAGFLCSCLVFGLRCFLLLSSLYRVGLGMDSMCVS